MFRKYRTHIFSFFVNIVFIAHVVIPHHHHIEQDCIADIHEHEECNSAEQNSMCGNDHSTDSNSDHCLLNNFLIFNHNNVKKELKSTCNYPKKLQPDLKNWLLSYKEKYHNLVLIHSNTKYDREIISLPEDRIILSDGLRAPPIV